jgi:hypothetical protein
MTVPKAVLSDVELVMAIFLIKITGLTRKIRNF